MNQQTIVLCSTLLAACIYCGAQARGPLAGIDTRTPLLFYYGNWDSTSVNTARMNYKVVVLEPSSNITPAQVATIKSGPDNLSGTLDDVKVYGYVSLGEDARPSAPVVGNGTGPRIDPRANPFSDSLQSIVTNNQLSGTASPGGTGFASYYLDDQNQDGAPDFNSTFGAPFVNAGDPAWLSILTTMTRDVDGRSGLNEILTSTTGDGLNMDGVFIDTVDTATPNSFGSFYEWTTPGMFAGIKYISDTYPAKDVFINRGIFFFTPVLEHYQFNPRPYINAVLVESYYTTSDDANEVSPFFDSSKHDFAPKINAEAGRPDGFTVFALGYDQPVTLPEIIKQQDFLECQREQGWILYRTNISIDQIRQDAATWNAANPDVSVPLWDSTALSGPDANPTIFGNQPPAPRIGIQQAIGRDGEVTVYWDVARDQTGPVRYNLYYTDQPTLNFATATKVASITPELPLAYTQGVGPGIYPYSFTLTGLTNGTPYQLAIRAEDALGQEDQNTQTLQALPTDGTAFATIIIDGTFTDWDSVPYLALDPTGDQNNAINDLLTLKIANDTTHVYFLLETAPGAAFFTNFRNNMFLDADSNPATGFVGSTGLGSELLNQNFGFYDQRNGNFSGIPIAAFPVTQAVSLDGAFTEFSIPRNAAYEASSPFGVAPVFSSTNFTVVFTSDQADNSFGDYLPSGGSVFTITAFTEVADWSVLD